MGFRKEHFSLEGKRFDLSLLFPVPSTAIKSALCEALRDPFAALATGPAFAPAPNLSAKWQAMIFL
jgi:hypothetical protein